MSFFKELKRRNVFRVAIAYGITTWLIAQIAGLSASSFMAPEWVMKMIITILILGLPVAMLMAWAYELTPDGLRREADTEAGQSTARATASKLDRTITIAMILAVAYFSYDKFILDPQRDAALLEKATQQATEVSPQVDAIKPVNQAPSIAVLPFVNMSDDAGNEYFSEGLSEELLNLLVRIPKLRVAARTSSFSYKGKDTRIAQIGAELNVAHVLEGSVRKAGNRVRITVQLIKADDGFHLWSQTYDRTLDDIFVTQDEIAAAVVAALKVSLLGTRPEPRKTNAEVYTQYLQGKYFNSLDGEDNLEKALTAFGQALAIDPDYAPAWVGIGRTYASQSSAGWRSPEEGFARSRDATDRALAIDGNSAAAWASLAYLKINELNWEGAQTAIDRARQLEPNNVDVLGVAARLANTLGQFTTATALLEQAVGLDPLNLSSLNSLGRIYTKTGRYDDAIVTGNRLLALGPDHPAGHLNLGRTYLFKGDPERALVETKRNPPLFFNSYQEAAIHFTLGNEAQSQAIIKELVVDSAHRFPGPMAVIFAWRGENDRAFEWFEIAFQQNEFRLRNFLGNEWLKGIENDPRYPVLLEKIGLLEAWKAMPKSGE